MRATDLLGPTEGARERGAALTMLLARQDETMIHNAVGAILPPLQRQLQGDRARATAATLSRAVIGAANTADVRQQTPVLPADERVAAAQALVNQAIAEGRQPTIQGL